MKKKTFRLHFNRLAARKDAPDLWVVRWGRRTLYGRSVDCYVPLTTVYRGNVPDGQPRAFLQGCSDDVCQFPSGRIVIGFKKEGGGC